MKIMTDDIVNDFTQALLSIDRLAAKKIIDDHIHQISPIQFIEDVVGVALERIGAEWQEGIIALSQVYMGGRICETLVDEILPPGAPERKDQPKMAICVLSDHHQLGKVIVYSLLRASGFELADYGTIEVDGLVERIVNEKIEILLISVLMLQSALKIKRVKEKLTEINHEIKIIVGGAPFRFDEQLWQEVGADAMCRTASDAVNAIHNVTGGAS
jgi:methanogenic corrinoid protein MtbC1